MNLPPNVPGALVPERLLSKEEMLILQEHYRLARGCKSAEAYEKSFAGWSDRQLQVARGLYDRLFRHGFVVSGQDQDGRITFGFRLKSIEQQIMELSDDDFRAYRAGKIAVDRRSGRLVRVQRGAQG